MAYGEARRVDVPLGPAYEAGIVQLAAAGMRAMNSSSPNTELADLIMADVESAVATHHWAAAQLVSNTVEV